MAEYKVRAFLDTNILIDLLMEGRPGAPQANVIFQAAKSGLVEVFITTQSIIDAEYVMSNAPAFSRENLFNALLKLMGFVNIGHMAFQICNNI